MRVPEDIGDDSIRKDMLMEKVKGLIGDMKKRESTFIYSGSVRNFV